MQHLYQILFVAAHAASIAFITFPLVLPLPALAKPVTRSLLSQTMTVHHISRRPVRTPKSKDPKTKATAPHNFLENSANVSLHPRSRHAHEGPGVYAGVRGRSGDINVNTVMDQISILSSWHSKARTNAQNLKTYSSQASTSRHKGASEFERKCASELTAFNTNSRGFETTLKQLSADKGRAYYDNRDSIETLLNNMIDFHKDVLSCFTDLVYRTPELGPVLGPTIYGVKCTLDAILNLTENLTDAIINALRRLILEYNEAVCKPGIDVLGICL
ncbi:hypothetical protein EDB83DRAFT_2512936 [Lactarius deliciosus]|nr:hypothetical protein EDB83DRAFT_2512936 [Lactarius deliciosus]